MLVGALRDVHVLVPIDGVLGVGAWGCSRVVTRVVTGLCWLVLACDGCATCKRPVGAL